MNKSVALLSGLALLAIGGISGWFLRERKGFLGIDSRAPFAAKSGANGHQPPSAQDTSAGTGKNGGNSSRSEQFIQRLAELFDAGEEISVHSAEFADLNREILLMKPSEALDVAEWLWRKLGETQQNLFEKRAENPFRNAADSLSLTAVSESLRGDPWETENRLKSLEKFKPVDPFAYAGLPDLERAILARKISTDLPRLKIEIEDMRTRNEEGVVYTAACQAVIDEMAEKEPAAALDFALHHSIGLNIADLGASLIDRLMQSNPKETMEKLVKMEKVQLQAVSEFARQWADLDPAALRVWQRGKTEAVRTCILAALVEHGELDSETLLQEMTDWPRQPPEGTQLQRETTDSNDPEEPLQRAIESIGSRLAAYPSLSKWEQLQQLPMVFRTPAGKALVRDWLMADIFKGSEFLRGLPPGDLKNFGIERLILNHGLLHEDPAAALQWAMHHSVEKQRLVLVKKVVQQWRANDPHASIQAEAALPNAIQSALMTNPDSLPK